MAWEGRASQSKLLDKVGTAGKNPDHQGETSLIPQPEEGLHMLIASDSCVLILAPGNPDAEGPRHSGKPMEVGAGTRVLES